MVLKLIIKRCSYVLPEQRMRKGQRETFQCELENDSWDSWLCQLPLQTGTAACYGRHGMSWLLQAVTIAKYNTKGQQFLPGSQ